MRKDIADIVRVRTNRKGCRFKDVRRSNRFVTHLDSESNDSLDPMREPMGRRFHPFPYDENYKDYIDYRMLDKILMQYIGKTYNQIYSDFHRIFSSSSLYSGLLHRYLINAIERNVVMHDCNGSGIKVPAIYTRHSQEYVSVDRQRWYVKYYIHPETNLLAKSNYTPSASSDTPTWQSVYLGNHSGLECHIGVWYYVEYAEQRIYEYYSHAFNRKPDNDSASEAHFAMKTQRKYSLDAFGNPAAYSAGQLVAVKKKQLKHRQLKKYNLEDYGLNN